MFVSVFITLANEREAFDIGEKLVKERLVACVKHCSTIEIDLLVGRKN